MAKRIEAGRKYEGGIEATLDLFAITVFVMGIIAAIVTVVLLRLIGLIVAFFIVFNAAIGWLLLRSIAEIIRLQKKSAGIDFSGRISKCDHTVSYRCSECNSYLFSNTRCDTCGAKIEDDA